MHHHFGPEFAVLAGAVSTYSVKGIIQDLGKALDLPKEDLRILSKQLHSQDARDLRGEMLELPAFRDKVEAPGWRDLLALAPQLMHAPRGLGQHVGGMVLSDSPLPEMVPIRESAIEGRYIMDWNKDSTADAGFAKIDLLSLPVLDQIEEALDLVEERQGIRPDISAIDTEDDGVYGMLSEGRSKGVFLLQSPAQLKMGQRLQATQPAGPGLPGGSHQAGRWGAGERRVQVRGQVPARGGVGLRPPAGAPSPGAGLWDHRMAGAGGAADIRRGWV